MIIGDKNIFAFEYEVEVSEPILMIRNQFWIQGKLLGNFEDSGTLSAIHRSLERLISKSGNFYEEGFLSKSANEVLLMMIPNLYNPEKKFPDFSDEEQARLIKYDKYLFNFGENYDSTILRIYATNGLYNFIWRSDSDTEVQHGVVTLQDLKKVFDELAKRFP